MAPAAVTAPKKGAGKLIVTLTLVLAVGGGLIALYFGRELVEARKARVMPRPPATAPTNAPATTPAPTPP
jgi:hypothetical protein